MVGSNYDISNGLLRVGEDIFLRLAADSRHPDLSGQEIMTMGQNPYKWRNHWLWKQR
jgi:hypothetical protein